MPVWDPLQQQFAEADTLFKPTLTNQPTINAEGGFLGGADLSQDQLVSRYDFGAGKFTPGVRPKAGQASFLFYPIDGLIGADEFTLEYWQKLDVNWSSHNSGKALFALQGSTGGNRLNLFNVFSGTSTCRAEAATNIPAQAYTDSWSASVASLGLVDLAWNNFAITLKTGTLTFYVNGVSKGTITGVNYLPIWADTTKDEGVLVGGETGANNNIWTSDIRISHTARVPGQTPTLRSIAGSMAVNAGSTSGSVPTFYAGALNPQRSDFHTTPETMESAVTVAEGQASLAHVRVSSWTVAVPMKAGAPDATRPTAGASGSFSYNWQVVDQSLDWWHDRGIEKYWGADSTPILLGGNPGFDPQLYVDLHPLIGWGYSGAVPNNFASFATLQTDLLAHAASRGRPIQRLAASNEPNIGPSTWAGTQAQLLDLWATWAAAVKAAHPTVEIGAGELSDVGQTAWMDAWMAKRAASGVHPDFFSIHDYSGSLTGLDQARGLVSKYETAHGVASKPVAIGEFNWSNINDESGVQRFRGGFWHLRSLNSAYMTAYQIHGLDVGGIERVTWAHTGSSYGTVYSGINYSTMIMVDYDGKHFAPYNAMQGWKTAAYNRSLLATTKTLPPGVYGVATKDPSATKYGFVFANWGWANRNSRTVNVTISNLPAGSYTLTRYLVDETHSSRWDVAADNPVGDPYDSLAVVESRTDTAANLSALTFTLPRWSSTFVTLEPSGPAGGLTGTSNGTSSDSGSLTVFLGSGGGTVATDTFTDSNGTTLASHVGETGATWTRATPTLYGSTASLTSNRARGDGDYFQYYASGVPNNAEYDVSADIYVASLVGTGLAGVLGRKTLDNADTSYAARYYMGTGSWELYKIVAGTYTLLGSYAQTLTAATSYALKFEVRNATKKLFVDGVERISSADNAITAKGAPGIVGGTSTSSTGLHIDNFSVVDASAGVTPLNGASSGTSTTSGSLSLTGAALAGTSAGTSTTIGALQQTAHLDGTSGGASATTGTLTGGAGQDSFTAQLGIADSRLGNIEPGYPGVTAPQQSLTGTSTGTSGTTGALRVARLLAGTSAGTSTTTGVAKATWRLAGASFGAASTSGTLSGGVSSAPSITIPTTATLGIRNETAMVTPHIAVATAGVYIADADVVEAGSLVLVS